jgi:hypothetical protein
MTKQSCIVLSENVMHAINDNGDDTFLSLESTERGSEIYKIRNCILGGRN